MIGGKIGRRDTRLCDREEVAYPDTITYYSLGIRRPGPKTLQLNAKAIGRQKYRKIDSSKPLFEFVDTSAKGATTAVEQKGGNKLKLPPRKILPGGKRTITENVSVAEGDKINIGNSSIKVDSFKKVKNKFTKKDCYLCTFVVRAPPGVHIVRAEIDDGRPVKSDRKGLVPIYRYSGSDNQDEFRVGDIRIKLLSEVNNGKISLTVTRPSGTIISIKGAGTASIGGGGTHDTYDPTKDILGGQDPEQRRRLLAQQAEAAASAASADGADAGVAAQAMMAEAIQLAWGEVEGERIMSEKAEDARNFVIDNLKAWQGGRADLLGINIGAGPGSFSALVEQSLHSNIIDIDLAPRVKVEGAPRSNKFIIGDACHLPIQSESQDFIISTFLLNYVSDTGRAADEMMRVLKGGGRAALILRSRKLELLAEEISGPDKRPYAVQIEDMINILKWLIGLKDSLIEKREIPDGLKIPYTSCRARLKSPEIIEKLNTAPPVIGDDRRQYSTLLGAVGRDIRALKESLRIKLLLASHPNTFEDEAATKAFFESRGFRVAVQPLNDRIGGPYTFGVVLDKPTAGEVAFKIHDENMKLEYLPDIPKGKILCHVITDSILPAGQRGMLDDPSILEMRGKGYSEKVARFSVKDNKNFIDELRARLAVLRREYKDYIVEFDVACPDDKELVKKILSDVGINALAFTSYTDIEADIVQVEGIMLALRALHSGDIEKLKAAYKFLGNTLSEKQSAITSIDTFMRLVTFGLPHSKVEDHDKARIMHEIAEYIRQAA